MDKIIKKTVNKKIIVTAAVLLILLIVLKFLIGNYQPTYNIKKSELMTSFVSEKKISKSIMAVGTVESLNKVLIESKIGGLVTEIIGISGNNIIKDKPILRLSNEELEIEHYLLLELLEKQKQQLKISKNEFDTKDVDNSELLLELDYKIALLESSVDKNTLLLKSGRISEKTLDDIKNEYNYWLQKKVLTTEKWKRVSKLQESTEQYITLEINSINNRINNLNIQRSRLVIIAPYSGILNLENFDIGQNISSRQKLAEIDRQDGFKLTSNIDEFYISGLNIGDIATFNNTKLKLNFISPVVAGKKVKLEFNFVHKIPENIKSGQSFNIKIIQSTPEIKKVIESGGFIKESGGNWIYKVENSKAIKVPITLGIKNSEYNEVLTGLELGDQVIISSYKKFSEYEVVNLEE
ncbi:MAG: hypothetical protein OCD02_18775 [Spirochaetaceae bacterium]